MTSLDHLLRNEALDVHFQPILSLKQKAIVGLEALARPHTMNVCELFRQATEADRLLEVDRLCRRKAMENYSHLHRTNEVRPLLFFNFETSILDDGIVGSGAVLAAAQNAGLKTSEIVIEVNESKVTDIHALVRFVEHHRKLGFLIALDDLGAGHSNLSRIVQLRPDIIKLDRSLIDGIDHDFVKQETMRSLVSLCKHIGSLALAEGVETSAEVDTCAALGAELFQGFYFGRPRPLESEETELPQRAREASERLRKGAIQSMYARRLEEQHAHDLLEKARRALLRSTPTQFDAVLATLVRRDPSIEACYLLNQDGLQISDTHMGSENVAPGSHLFAPAQRGTDHSSKEYFFSVLEEGVDRHITDTYISMATGGLCRTLSIACCERFVLCIDLKIRLGSCRVIAGKPNNEYRAPQFTYQIAPTR